MKRGYHLTQADCDRLKLLCTVHSQATAARIVGCSPNAVVAAKKRGWKQGGRKLRPAPSDIALLASDMPKMDLCSHYGCDWETLNRWLSGIDRRYVKQVGGAARPKPIPGDFEQVWRRLGMRGTARHYGVAQSTVNKWQHALGLFKNRRKPANDNRIGWVERYIAEKRA
jgi:hypothetical protein